MITARASLFLPCGWVVALGLAVAAATAQGQPASAATGPAATLKPVPFADLRRQTPIHGDAQAVTVKAAVCAACHGPQGIAIAPNFPNLAGQPATYLYVQLRQFKEGQRRDPVMSGQAATLSDEDMRDLAAHYAALPPKPRGIAEVRSAGARLYLSGAPARGIPPCQGCHDPTLRIVYPAYSITPQPPWSTFPHLDGQSSTYLSKALGDFRSGARANSSNARIMQGIAATLTDADVRALAAYLNTR